MFGPRSACCYTLPGRADPCTSVQVFINCLTATANDICKEQKRQTISADDVFAALQDLELGELVGPLKDALERAPSLGMHQSPFHRIVKYPCLGRSTAALLLSTNSSSTLEVLLSRRAGFRNDSKEKNKRKAEQVKKRKAEAAPAPAPAPAPACLAADRARSRLCENTGASCQQHGAALQALIPGRMHLRAVASVTASNPCIALSRPSSNALRPVSGQRQPECFGAVHRCHAGSPCTAAAGGRTRERGAQHAHQALHARGAEEKAQRGDAQLRAQRRQRGVRVLRHLPAAQPRRVGHAAGCRYQRMLAAVSLLCTRTAQTSS